MNDAEIHEKIISSIKNSKYRWRTPQGIQKATGLPLETITEILENSDSFVRSRKENAAGQSLYAVREQIRKEASVARKALSALTNRPLG